MGRISVMCLTVASFCALIRAPPSSWQEPEEDVGGGHVAASDHTLKMRRRLHSTLYSLYASSRQYHGAATQATPFKSTGRKAPRSTSKSPSGNKGGGGNNGGNSKGGGGPSSTSKPATSTSGPGSSSQSQAGGGYSSSASAFNAASRTKNWTSNTTTSDANKESPEEKPDDTS